MCCMFEHKDYIDMAFISGHFYRVIKKVRFRNTIRTSVALYTFITHVNVQDLCFTFTYPLNLLFN